MIKDMWEGPRYTTDELNARLKFFIGIILGLTLFSIGTWALTKRQYLVVTELSTPLT